MWPRSKPYGACALRLKQCAIDFDDNLTQRCSRTQARHRAVKFAWEQNRNLFGMQVNQRFAADLGTKTDIVRIVKRTVGDNFQSFVTRANDLLTRQHDMNINVLPMIFRTLFAKRFSFAFDNVKEQVIPFNDVFSRRQRVRLPRPRGPRRR